MGSVTDIVLGLLAWDVIRGEPKPRRGRLTPEIAQQMIDQGRREMYRANPVNCMHCALRVYYSPDLKVYLHLETESIEAETADDGFGPYAPHKAQPDPDFDGYYERWWEDRSRGRRTPYRRPR